MGLHLGFVIAGFDRLRFDNFVMAFGNKEKAGGNSRGGGAHYRCALHDGHGVFGRCAVAQRREAQLLERHGG